MKEIIAYLKAKHEKLSEGGKVSEMKIKFKDKNVEEIIEKLLSEGMVFEPKPGLIRWLG